LKNNMTKNKILAAHHGGGRDCQGGAQQGTGARGEQYLDSPARSHTIAPKVLFGVLFHTHPKQNKFHQNKKNTLTECPFFRSKRSVSQFLDE